MVDEREDPIEAIKRRNEERARRLRERIARGDFGNFETPLEAVDESLPAGLDSLEAPESDFDLSSFPPPPDSSVIALNVTKAPPAGPPLTAPPSMAAALEPISEPPTWVPEEPPPLPAFETEPTPSFAAAETPDAFAGLELTDLDLESVGDFLAPEPWDAAGIPPPILETPAPVSASFPEPIGAPTEPAPGIEIVVEPTERVTLREPAIFADRQSYAEIPSAGIPADAPIGLPMEYEPALREEEAEAIKSTIERELREVPPEAPPITRPVPAAVVTEARTSPRIEPSTVPVYTPAQPVETPVLETVEPSEVFIGVEVHGNRVRIERRNITLAAAVELFRAIIDRYENR